jgi:hypothetical protein
MELKVKDAWVSTVVRLFVDPWIAMITLPPLAGPLHWHVLAQLGYWQWVLLVIGIQALWGTDHVEYILKGKEK